MQEDSAYAEIIPAKNEIPQPTLREIVEAVSFGCLLDELEGKIHRGKDQEDVSAD